MEQSKWEAILTKLARWHKSDVPGQITVSEWYDITKPCDDCGQTVTNRVTTYVWRDGAWHQRCKACKLSRTGSVPFQYARIADKEFGDTDNAEEEVKRSKGRPKKPQLSPKPQLRPNANVQTFEYDHVIIRLYDHGSLASRSPSDPDDPQNDQNV